MMVAAYRQTYSPSLLACSEGWQQPGAECANWVERLLQLLCHDDSTVNIIMRIIRPHLVHEVHKMQPALQT